MGLALNRQVSLAVHGGAGSGPLPASDATLRRHLRTVLAAGRQQLAAGGSALETVLSCTAQLEDDALFNAGCGAVPTTAGGFELDASAMNGSDLRAGAVAAVSGVRNPILLAAKLLTGSEAVMLAGAGASDYARERGLAMVPVEYFETGWRRYPRDHDIPGTVGAVARDSLGHLAAATSTGGRRGQIPGRVGDSPLIGAGSWADDRSCAVSCTGIGEDILRVTLAARLALLMEIGGLALAAAAERAVTELVARVNGEGGLIAVDGDGRIITAQSSEHLLCAWFEHGGPGHTALQGRIRVARR